MDTRFLTTKGWLLQKVPLANDDCALTFLTETHGKMTVFASKLQRSKKKAAELDYFRWLELELTQPKNSFKLSSVKTITDFSPYLTNYERLEFGFEALGLVRHFCPEEKRAPEVVQLLHEVLTMKPISLAVVNVFFSTKLLWFNGVLPRFDLIREAVWVNPATLLVTLEPQTRAHALNNHQRQILEWIRRTSAEELIEKCEQFKPEDLKVLQSFLLEVLKNH